MPVMKLLAGVGVAFIIACSPGQATAGARASSTPRPTSAAQPRIAILTGQYAPSETLIIADLGGRALARATFASMPRPLITNAGDVLPAPVRLAAGAAYYAEPTGRIHRLDPSAGDTVVATFPLTTAQQELSFAVSPDGKQLIAMVLTAPPVHDPPPQNIEQPFFQPGTRWTAELDMATVSGATRTLARTDLGPAVGRLQVPMMIAGWDDQGPLALLDAQIATQQPLASRHLPGSALVHLGLEGTRRDQVGGPACRPLDELHDGTVLCYSGSYPTAYDVRSAAGQLLWRQDLGGAFYFDPALSPDGRRIAVENALFAQDTRPVSIARQSIPRLQVGAEGWVTATTLAVSGPSGGVQVVDLSDLDHPRDLGLTGTFIGTL